MQQTINIGSAANDGTGDPLRTAFGKINDNFDELYAVAAGSGAVPVGGIIFWSGNISDAGALSPTWEICDGTANAPGPDLRDKFIVGANQDDAGVAKSNVEGSLKQTGGVTGVSHSAHADLTHAGGAVGDHTGLTHGLTIADHPALTHPAITFVAQTLAHGDHAIASFSGAIASRADLSRPSGTFASHAAGSLPSGSIASRADLSMPSGSIASHTLISVAAYASKSGVTITGTVTRSVVTTGGLVLTQLSSAFGANAPAYASQASGSAPSVTFASHAAGSLPSLTFASANNASMPSGSIASGADVSMPSLTHSHAAVTLTHADHSIASSSQAIAQHAAVAHTLTAPAAHGTAGTLTHSFTQPNDHSISAHDTVLSLPVYFALAFIQRMQ